MPWMRGKEGVAHGARLVALSGVPATKFRDGRDGVRNPAESTAIMVSCHVADDGSENRAQCQKPVRHLRIWQLSDSVGMVTEASQCDDPHGSRTFGRAGGSGRDLCGRTKGRSPWAWG